MQLFRKNAAAHARADDEYAHGERDELGKDVEGDSPQGKASKGHASVTVSRQMVAVRSRNLVHQSGNANRQDRPERCAVGAAPTAGTRKAVQIATYRENNPHQAPHEQGGDFLIGKGDRAL